MRPLDQQICFTSMAIMRAYKPLLNALGEADGSTWKRARSRRWSSG
jgi:hypothetical protein